MKLDEAKTWMEKNQRLLTVEGSEDDILFFRMLHGKLQFRRTGEEWFKFSLRWVDVDQFGQKLNLDKLIFKIPMIEEE